MDVRVLVVVALDPGPHRLGGEIPRLVGPLGVKMRFCGIKGQETIQVAALTMLGARVVVTDGETFQHMGMNSSLLKTGGEFAGPGLLLAITLFDLLDTKCPLQLQLSVGQLLVRQIPRFGRRELMLDPLRALFLMLNRLLQANRLLQTIPHQRQHPLLRRQPVDCRPSNRFFIPAYENLVRSLKKSTSK